jgi:raffinose/stachyose/melibiose transport system permease protein
MPHTPAAPARTALRMTTRTVRALLLIVVCLLFLFPLLIVLLTALQPEGDILSRGIAAIPEHLTLDNFPGTWNDGTLGSYYKNSILITLVKVPLGILVSALAAYPIAHLRYPLRRPIFVLFLLGLGFPVIVALYPLLQILRHIGLGGSLWVLLPPYIAFGIPFEVLVMRGAFSGVPYEMIEAGRVDGASELGIWARLCIPLVLPAVASLAILDAVATWNEFVMALILIANQSDQTLPLGLLNLQGQFTSNYAELAAGIILGLLPMVVLFVVARRWLVRGIATGAVKG